ncbi:MAG: polymer-forming cytoskeletal protein [Sphingomonadales bacterium]|nr:polymer-forming cytoskeletal protein [Sphingomonadales bacterium]
MINPIKNIVQAGQNLNLLVEGSSIQGDLNANGDVRIDGELMGSINSTGRVALGPKSKVTGNVICQFADVGGHVVGNVEAAESLTLRAHCRINGDIKTARLVVEEGAQFSGVCSMQTAGVEKLRTVREA